MIKEKKEQKPRKVNKSFAMQFSCIGNSPCLNCKNRSVSCHAKCEKYKQYKIEMEILNKKERKARASIYDHIY